MYNDVFFYIIIHNKARADHVWTLKNYESMTHDSIVFNKWWSETNFINSKFELGLVTIDQFRESLKIKTDIPNEELVWRIFHKIYNTHIKPCFVTDNILPLSNEQQLTKAFSRYILGQSFAFYKQCEYTPYGNSYKNNIYDYLRKRDILSNDDIKIIRSFFDNFLDKCVVDHIITDDDANNYKEVVPLIEPYYISYKESDNTIKDIFNKY